MSSVEVKEVKAIRPDSLLIVAGMILAGIFALTYSFPINKEMPSTIGYLWSAWKTPDYQHGFFVLPFCLYLLWCRRDMMKEIPAQGSWWGLAFFALWAGVRLWGVYFDYTWFQHASVVIGVAAITLFVGGWQAILWAWPAILFMAFMVPLPGYAADVFSSYLQKMASMGSAFLIQTLGIPATRTDMVIRVTFLPDGLNVAEACSGIRMLMLFFALCVGGAFLMKKSPLWERILIVVSAIPIAVAANIVRLTLIAVFCQAIASWPSLLDQFPLHFLNDIADPRWPQDMTQTWAHNLPGLLMMPVGMLLLWIEWVLISKLFIEEPEDRTAVIRSTTRGLLPMATAPREPKGS